MLPEACDINVCVCACVCMCACAHMYERRWESCINVPNRINTHTKCEYWWHLIVEPCLFDQNQVSWAAFEFWGRCWERKSEKRGRWCNLLSACKWKAFLATGTPSCRITDQKPMPSAAVSDSVFFFLFVFLLLLNWCNTNSSRMALVEKMDGKKIITINRTDRLIVW